MPYDYPLVTVDSQAYPAYADLDDADAYLAPSLHAAGWVAATEERRAQALVTMTRILDRQSWLGQPTDEAQELAWPRTGTGVAGVEDDEVPEDIARATIEGALALLDGSDMQTAVGSPVLQSIRAGSVALTYYIGAGSDTTAQRFPLVVQELVRRYLSGYGPGRSGMSSGTDGCSVTDRNFGFGGGL